MLLVVLWRLCDKLRLRDLATQFLARGFVFSHEAARGWETRCAPLLADRLRAKRRGQGGTKWHADETDVRVNGAWYSRYHALDRDGNRVEALLRDTAGQVPAQVTTDGHGADPRAIRRTLGERVHHRTSCDKNKRSEHDHRGLKQRSYPLRGFGSCDSAARCCSAFEVQHQYFRAQARSGEPVSLAERHRRFQDRWAGIIVALAAA